MRTLWLCTALHAFTHIYHVALIPLYLLIRKDFNLTSDAPATFLVTAMSLAYFLPSYPMGILADKFSRKKLMGIGLAINGLGFICLAYAPNYATAVAAVALAGFGGSFYHPSATALIARLFPEATGKALGRVGIGAGVGTDGQILLCYDLLGVFTDFKPKFTKRYAKLTEVAVSGIQQYVKEVKAGTFPDDDHSYTVNEAEYDKFAAMVSKRRHI